MDGDADFPLTSEIPRLERVNALRLLRHLGNSQSQPDFRPRRILICPRGNLVSGLSVDDLQRK
jgi:hypothetical protein